MVIGELWAWGILRSHLAGVMFWIRAWGMRYDYDFDGGRAVDQGDRWISIDFRDAGREVVPYIMS